MSSPANPPPRLDVMSLKGGVGKTTLAYALAWAQATRSRRPVLLIDADLTGTCLGDLLDPVVAWHLEANLAHLLCEPPDTLPEQLAPECLPVYVPGRAGGERDGERATNAPGAAVVFCPSHAYSTQPTRVDRAVLEALIGQETAGAWVRHVLDCLITATHQNLGPLGGVVVDHSPGLAALQSAVLGDIAQLPAGRKVAMITTSDRVDLAMCKAASTTHHDELKDAAWIVNKAPSTWDPAAIERDDPSIAAAWQTSAFRIDHDGAIQDAYRRSALTAGLLDLGHLCVPLFGA